MKQFKLFGYVGEEIRSSDVSTMLAEAGGEDVTFDVFSKGGDLFEGYALYSLISNYPANVTVRVYGLAASAGSLMIMGADRIEMTEGSWLMIHNASQGAYGDGDDLEEAGKRLKTIQEPMSMAYAKRSGKKKEKVLELMKAETWYDANTAVQEGFADAVIEIEENEKAVAQFTEEEVKEFHYRNMPKSVQGFGQKQTKTPTNKDTNMSMKKIIAALNNGSDSPLAEDAEESVVVARINGLAEKVNSLQATLANKTETLDSVQTQLTTAESELETLRATQKESAITSLVEKAISDAKVKVSAETKEKLTTRAKLHQSQSDDALKAEIFSDMVMYAKHNGVTAGVDPKLSGGEGTTRKIQTGEPEPAVSEESDFDSTLSYEQKVDAKVEELMKADKELSVSEAVTKAKLELETE